MQSAKSRLWETPEGKQPGLFNQYIARENKEMEKETRLKETERDTPPIAIYGPHLDPDSIKLF